MTDQDALLRAVCEAPDDDAPRLIYADWLDDHGDGRQAEFIRRQVSLGLLSGTDLDFGAAAAPLRELWRGLSKWRYFLGDWTRFTLRSFDRGFNTYWSGPAARLVALLPTWWRAGPISGLKLEFDSRRDGSPDPAQCKRLSVWPSLRAVDLEGKFLTDGVVEAVVSDPEARTWGDFRAAGMQMTDRACEMIVASPLVDSTARVSVESPGLTPVGIDLIRWAFPAGRGYAGW